MTAIALVLLTILLAPATAAGAQQDLPAAQSGIPWASIVAAVQAIVIAVLGVWVRQSRARAVNFERLHNTMAETVDRLAAEVRVRELAERARKNEEARDAQDPPPISETRARLGSGHGFAVPRERASCDGNCQYATTARAERDRAVADERAVRVEAHDESRANFREMMTMLSRVAVALEKLTGGQP